MGKSSHCPHIFRRVCSKFGDHQSPFFVVRVCDRDVCLAYFVSSQRYYYCQLLLVSGLMAWLVSAEAASRELWANFYCCSSLLGFFFTWSKLWPQLGRGSVHKLRHAFLMEGGWSQNWRKKSDAWAISATKWGHIWERERSQIWVKKLLTLLMDDPQKPPEPRAQPC